MGCGHSMCGRVFCGWAMRRGQTSCEVVVERCKGGFGVGNREWVYQAGFFLWWCFLFSVNCINKRHRIVVKVENTNEKNVVAF